VVGNGTRAAEAASGMNVKTLPLLLSLAIAACAAAPDPEDQDIVDDKADGTSTTATYFDCEGFGTSNTTWLAISRLQHYVKLTIEGVGVNHGTKIHSTSSARTYSDWTTNVFLQSGDTLVIPTSLMSSGSGKISWVSSGVTRWTSQCTKKNPTGDQCLPLVDTVYPVDSTATASYTKVSTGVYTVTIPDATVGNFVYSIVMNVNGLLCTDNDLKPTSCSAVVADAASDRAYGDGASSGAPYVSTRTKTSSGYSWTAGIHDPESGEFPYTVTTDSAADGCHVVSIKPVL
jgi:hypothetical protein